jgi:hypothetical protein
MNAIHVYDWEDAPNSLRESVKDLIPAGYKPFWICYAELRQESPTYLAMFMSKAWIESVGDGWHKVFIQNTKYGEVRVGCARPVR